MKLSKLTLASAGILIMGISLTACTGANSKPSGPALTHDYADCTLEELAPDEKEKTATASAIAQKAQRRKTSSSEPDQDSAGCILVPDAK
ncbi:MAG: hypothetical protein DRR16_00130 [Candidatus Parabeggiatoa sp. nov. 3]|nr:MAG: hypothetical protein DRR00_00560 [Gammaproteobacteria bacterium]RKZ59290.1 MAG: hypothetical protein DRQ99_23960 [Gammaproteobacteria bacterium]RKZ90201.1 MAG: hypothetical protein DRR16_00130 [Gammaproteobacteria bacterium]